MLYVNSNVQQTFFNPTLNRGSIFVQLKPRSERQGRATISEVQDRLRRSLAGIPGIRAFPVPLTNLRIGSRGGAALYQYTLTSVDQAELYANAQRLLDRVKGAPGFADVDQRPDARRATGRGSTSTATPWRASGSTWKRSARRSIRRSARARSPRVYTPSNDYAVIIEADKAQALDPGVLSRITIANNAGQQIRLDAVATVSLVPGPVSVARQSQLPAVTITFNLAPGYTLGEAVHRHARA